jgi:hypothetical protein
MSEVKTVVKERDCFDSIFKKKETYTVYAAGNGEEFKSQSDAKKYNEKLERVSNFRKTFSTSHGNLAKGDTRLASKLGQYVNDKNIQDCFWIFPKKKEELDLIYNFIYKHYDVRKTAVIDMNIPLDQWSFIVIKESSSEYNSTFSCTMERVDEEIRILQGMIPDIKKIKQKNDDCESNNRDYSKFEILDLDK